MLIKAYLYIGSNNETHELEIDKIRETIRLYFEGFTEYEVTGFWKGNQEKTVKVEIVLESDNQKNTIIKLAKELKVKLNQDSIMIEFIPSNIAFI